MDGRFSVAVKEGYNTFYYQVRLVSRDSSFEVYEVTRNKDVITFRSNRPLLRAKGLKHKRPTWTHQASTFIYAGTIQQIIDGIMKQVDG